MVELSLPLMKTSITEILNTRELITFAKFRIDRKLYHYMRIRAQHGDESLESLLAYARQLMN